MLKNLILYICAFVLLSFTCISCEEKASAKLPELQRETEEVLLVQIDFDNWVVNSHKVSPDNRTFIYTKNVGDKQVLVVNGKEQEKKYDEIATYLVIFSPDSKHIAYAARLGNDWYMVLDGREIGPFDKVLAYEKYMFFSPDNQKVLYAVLKDGKVYVMVNDKQFGPYEDVSFGQGVFSSDGSVFAYVVKSGNDATMVVNGNEVGRYNAIPSWYFSPRGNRFAFIAREGDKSYVVVDGNKSPLYDSVEDFIFSPDGKRYAYIASLNKEYFVVSDGMEGKRYSSIKKLVFSPDGEKLAHTASKDMAFVVVNGEEIGAYYGVDAPVFSPDGKHIAFPALTKDGWIMVVDGKESKPYPDIISDQMFFSPDGKRIAFVVQASKHTHSSSEQAVQQKEEPETYAVVVDNKQDKTYKGIGYNSLSFSPNSQHFAYMAVDGTSWVAVLDGVKLGNYVEIGALTPMFTPDSDKLIFLAQNADEKFTLIVNGKEGKYYDGILTTFGGKVIIEDNETVRYLAASGNNIYLVTEKLISVSTQTK